MPLIATRGAASAQGFGEFAQSAVPNYIEDVFSTYLIKTPGSATAVGAVNNAIDLSTKGGMVWLKDRNFAYSHTLVDSARGVTQRLISDSTVAQASTSTYGFTSFNTNGFTLGAGGGALFDNGAAGTNVVTWTFRKQPKFFDVVTFTSDGTTAQAISHSLASAPGCILIKRTDAAQSWIVWHRGNGTTNYYTWSLNNTAAAASTSDLSAYMTSTSFQPNRLDDYLGNRPVSGGTYVAYLFAHNAGGFGLTGTDNVISCGSYTGNGSATGPVIDLGYEPQWVLIKNASDIGNWVMSDNMRNWSVTNAALLYANLSNAEATNTNTKPLATGFQPNDTSSSVNTSGATYIYIAIRRGPMKVPTSGTSVFTPLSRAGTSSLTTISSGSVGVVDTIMAMSRDVANGMRAWDRLRGVTNWLGTYTTQAETAASGSVVGFDSMTGVIVNDGTNEVINTNSAASPYINYMVKRAPSFFDEVCYTGTGSLRTVSHNLGVVPELLIVKRRDTVEDWNVYSATTGNAAYLRLNTTAAVGTAGADALWGSTTPTSSVFTVKTSGGTNASGGTYVAYLFATCAGVSKVGTYTGTGATQTISCGFTGGARWAMVKRTDTTGDWYVWDTARGMVAGTDPSLLLNSTAAEVNANSIYTTTGGFQIVSTAAGINASGGTYIYLAIA